jgi:hypothetical protein
LYGRRLHVLKQAGKLVAQAVAGSWREEPPRWNLTPTELVEIHPLLMAAGSVGLIWRKLRSTELADTAEAIELRNTFRLQVLHHAVHETEIAEAFLRLRSAGIEPVLGKGWAIARMYPERGMRPYGDIDVCVHPDHLEKTLRLIESPYGPKAPLDVQSRFKRLDRTYEDLYSRSKLVGLGKIEVRIIGLEDHLRFLCIHMLRHGLWKPLWLCDVALLMENLPHDFDWQRCLSGDERQSHWVLCSLSIAKELLTARMPPNLNFAAGVPNWTLKAILKQWGTADHYMRANPLRDFQRNWHEIPRALRLRWPNPIQATIGMNSGFNSYPRFPLQLAESTKRALAFFGTLSRRKK